jgi:chromosome segregation ATPase
MDNNIAIIIIALIGSVSGVLAFIEGRASRKAQEKNKQMDAEKTHAETIDIATDTYITLIAPLEKTVEDLRAELKKMRSENEGLRIDLDIVKMENKKLKAENAAIREENSEINDKLNNVIIENALLRRWAKDLSVQVSKYETPSPEPIIRKNNQIGEIK